MRPAVSTHSIKYLVISNPTMAAVLETYRIYALFEMLKIRRIHNNLEDCNRHGKLNSKRQEIIKDNTPPVLP